MATKRLSGSEQVENWRQRRQDKILNRKVRRAAREAKKPRPVRMLPQRPPGRYRPPYTFHVVYPKYPSRDALMRSMGFS